jgi:2-oxoglutarate ferredoxin oxidoreductase subunit gamma
MTERLLIAGSGGQGVLLIGKLLASAALRDVAHVTFFPAYGVEVRGGSAHCQVILSSEEIASPVSETFESIIVMNQESADRFLPRMKTAQLVVFNQSLCQPPDVTAPLLAIDASALAVKAGDVRVANLILLGAYLARRPVIRADHMESEIKRTFGIKNPDMARLNIQAFWTGIELGA